MIPWWDKAGCCECWATVVKTATSETWGTVWPSVRLLPSPASSRLCQQSLLQQHLHTQQQQQHGQQHGSVRAHQWRWEPCSMIHACHLTLGLKTRSEERAVSEASTRSSLLPSVPSWRRPPAAACYCVRTADHTGCQDYWRTLQQTHHVSPSSLPKTLSFGTWLHETTQFVFHCEGLPRTQTNSVSDGQTSKPCLQYRYLTNIGHLIFILVVSAWGDNDLCCPHSRAVFKED